VIKQVGHADYRMTLEVYAQLQQRARRENGARFDVLVRDVREQLARRRKTPSQQSIGSEIGSATPNARLEPLERGVGTSTKSPYLQAKRQVAGHRFELRASIFSIVGRPTDPPCES
jgi:hypothetical protein